MRGLVHNEHRIVVIFRRDNRDLQVGLVLTTSVEHVLALVVGLPDERLDPMRVADVAPGNMHADGFAGVREGLMYSTSYAADMLDRQRYWVNLAYQYLTGEIELEESYSYTGAAELVSVQNIGDYEGV